MSDLLVLWDVDGTLLNADGVGGELYDLVFLQLFGRPLPVRLPMAGRTDRAIILQTLELAGIPEPRRYVDPFIAGLTAHAPSVREAVAARGRALPGAAAALSALAAPGITPAPGIAAAPGITPTAGIAAAPGITPAAPGGPGWPLPAGGQSRVRQSVLTGNIRPVAEVKLAALGLRDPLDLCIGAYGDDHEVRSELVGVARRRAAAVHGRSPDDFDGLSTVLIGDTPLDIEAALASGARAVGVATGRHSAADLLAAGAHAVLPDLTDTDLVVQAILSPATLPAPPGGAAASAVPALYALSARRVTPAFGNAGLQQRRPSVTPAAVRGPSSARQPGEQRLRRPVQPRFRRDCATWAAVAHPRRVTSSQSYRSVDPPLAVASLSRSLSVRRLCSGCACFPSSSTTRP